MAGTINSLGIGSGVLTADVIDQLKNNEKSATVDPIKAKEDLNLQKQQALDLLDSLMTNMKGPTASLADDVAFAKREITSSSAGVGVSVNDGVSPQSFSITNVSLAKTSVQQSGTFATTTSGVSSAAGTMALNVGNNSYNIDYSAGMTLEDFRDAINETAGSAVTASILQIGEGAYSLIVKSDETGADQNITMVDLSGNLDANVVNKVAKSGNFTTTTDTVATTDGSMTLNVGTLSTTINYTAGMNLTELQTAINNDETLKGSVVASLVDDGQGNVNLVLNPIGLQDGADITITDNNAGLDTRVTTDLAMTNGNTTEVQSAKDATFTYNGIDLTRSSNTIDDIIIGVTLELKEDGANSNISITQDTNAIADQVSGFVESYNSMMSQLNSMTLADLEENKVGIFNGDSSIRNLGRELTRLIITTDDQGRSLTQYGIDINEDGTMSFNRSDFDAKANSDMTDLQEFFSGSSTLDQAGNVITKDGVFDTLNKKLDDYVGLNGTFTILKDGLTTEAKNLQDNYDKALDRLNQRYDTMTQQFIAYDAMINAINSQSTLLQQQIDMAINTQQ